MHVCLLSDGYPPWERGGAQRIAAQLATGYRERGHDVSVITTVERAADAGQSTNDGVSIYRLHTPKRRSLLPRVTVENPFVVEGVERALDACDPDIVHAHNVHWLSKRSLALAAERDLPVVKTFHDTGTLTYGEMTHFTEAFADGGPVDVPTEAYRIDSREQTGHPDFPFRRNRRLVDRHVDVGVAVSRELGRALEANDVACDRTVHNGVDVASYVESTVSEATFRRRHDLGDDSLVLFGGRTSHNKGGTHLAEAFGRLSASVDVPVCLVVTGDTGYVEQMRTVAGPAGDRIVELGWLTRDELRAAYHAAAVVATPSIHLDPFPTINLEAFACGTPVVTTAFGGAKELVTHGENGYVVNPFDVAALADAVAEFVRNPETAAAYGAAGRRTVRTAFTGDQMVAESLEVLREARNRPPTADWATD